jgi:hypothetical protein
MVARQRLFAQQLIPSPDGASPVLLIWTTALYVSYTASMTSAGFDIAISNGRPREVSFVQG